MNFNNSNLETNKVEKVKTPENKIKEGVDFVFEQTPELAKIGTEQQYSKYLETIFPDSKIKDIVYHGNKNDFKDTGFKKTKDIGENYGYSEDGQFYGFYFGNYYSHYAHSNKISYPVLLNIKNLKIINPHQEENLSSLNMNISIKEQYNLTNEDGILEVGPEKVNENVSEEEFRKYEKEIVRKYSNFFDVEPSDLETNFEEVLSYKNILKYLNAKGITSLGISELVVFEPEQIYILGSNQDIEKFKEFVSENKEK